MPVPPVARGRRQPFGAPSVLRPVELWVSTLGGRSEAVCGSLGDTRSGTPEAACDRADDICQGHTAEAGKLFLIR